MLALAIGWIVLGVEPSSEEPIRRQPSIPASQPPAGTDKAGGTKAQSIQGIRAQSPTASAPPADAVKAYDGRGVIRGQVLVDPGVDFPDHWELVVEPARFLEGRDRAVRRVLSFDGAQRDFSVEDLPLGGYEVSARAAGMNGIPEPVLLYSLAGREDLPGAKFAYLTLKMTPAGFLDGSIVDDGGVPVADFPVYLARTSPPHDPLTLDAKTDPAGNYLFPVVLDGEYEISFGDREHPLLPPERFGFVAPSMRYPERSIPQVTNVLFRVFDELGFVVPNASVRGYAKGAGSLDLITDDEGEANAAFLPLGKYRITARAPSGKRGKVDFETKTAERTRVIEIVVKP